MGWLASLFGRVTRWRREVAEPFDVWDADYPDSAPPVPPDLDCPDTQPTSPGALDSDLGRLS